MFAIRPACATAGEFTPQAALITEGIDTGNFEDTIAEVSAKLRKEINAFHANAMASKIMEALGKHDTAGAQEALKKTLSNSPEMKDNSVIKLSQGEINFWQGDFAGAYTESAAVVNHIEKFYAPRGPQKDDNQPSENAFISDAYFDRATAEMRIGRVEQAVKDIEKAMLFSARPYMPLNKCRALMMLQNYKEAATAYDQAFTMDEKTAESSDKKTICAILEKQGVKSKACSSGKNK
jgi:tetratricopeptide (TPR) repeat protein